MIVDIQTQMSDGQVLTSTAVSTDVLDLDNDNNIGKGEPLAVAVCLTVAADFTTTDETYNFIVESSVDEAFTAPIAIAGSGPLNGSTLPAGHIVVIPLGHFNERYLRVNYTLAGTTPSATVDTYLLPLSDIDSFEAYPSGYTI